MNGPALRRPQKTINYTFNVNLMEKHKSSTAAEAAARQGQKPESPGPEPGRVNLQEIYIYSPVEERCCFKLQQQGHKEDPNLSVASLCHRYFWTVLMH